MIYWKNSVSYKVILKQSKFLVIIQFRYLYLLSIRQYKVTKSWRRRYPTSLWSCHIVAIETSDDVTKTTSLQRLIMTSLNVTLQRRRFCNVVWHFHRRYMSTSGRRWIVTSQRRCNDVIVPTGLVQCQFLPLNCFMDDSLMLFSLISWMFFISRTLIRVSRLHIDKKQFCH